MAKTKLLPSVLLFFILALTTGCVRLPEHARPHFLTQDDSYMAGKEGFGYRQLTVADFQATSLPEDYRQYRHTIGAQSCITIRPAKSSAIRITRSSYQDVSFYAGTVAQLTFEAVFVPECSWWNPDIGKNREEYVLQHEQIHFALAELAARQLARQAKAEITGFVSIGDNGSEVIQELTEKFHDMGREATEQSLKEQTDFDEDTSVLYNPRLQRKWLKNILYRLKDQDSI